MNARSVLISFYSAPVYQQISPPTRRFEPGNRPQLQSCSCERANIRHFFSGSARIGLIRRCLSSTGRVRADVKSETRGVAESPPPLPEPVKIGLDDYADDGDVSTMPWWEQFPRRWVIVILCFTAFLLCNMDRVSS